MPVIYGTISDKKAIFDAVKSDVHDVVCQLPTHTGFIKNTWHDVALPVRGCSYIRIPDEGSAGDVFPYDGVRLTTSQFFMEIAYTIGDFLIAFRTTADLPDQTISIGAGCFAPALTAGEAKQIVNAVGVGEAPDAVEGFERIWVDGPEEEGSFDFWCKELACGLAFCVDAEQEAWLQATGELEGMYSTTYDIHSVSNDGKTLTVRTDKCIFILPIGGDGE